MASFADDNYMVQVDADLSSGSTADIFVRYIDPNNASRIRLESGSPNNIYLHKIEEVVATSGWSGPKAFSLIARDRWKSGSASA